MGRHRSRPPGVPVAQLDCRRLGRAGLVVFDAVPQPVYGGGYGSSPRPAERWRHGQPGSLPRTGSGPRPGRWPRPAAAGARACATRVVATSRRAGGRKARGWLRGTGPRHHVPQRRRRRPDAVVRRRALPQAGPLILALGSPSGPGRLDQDSPDGPHLAARGGGGLDRADGGHEDPVSRCHPRLVDVGATDPG